MKEKLIKRGVYLLFCALLGVAIAAVVWVFLRVMGLGIDLLWHTIPEKLNFPLYTILLCLLGGLILGLYKNRVGNYPDELDVVMGKVKKEGFYPYDKVPAMLLCALLPLLFGASIGPEAGLTGVIVGLCYWAGDKMAYTRKELRGLSEIGISAALGVIFGSPLFGLAAPLEERTDSREETVVPKAHKLVSNVVAVLAAFGTFWVLGRFFGGGSGLPRIDAPDITNTERLWGIPVALVGVVFGYLYLAFEHGTHRFFARLQEKYPILVSTLLGGLILGVMGTVLPLTMFSGEHEIHTLMETYLDFAPWVLILTGTAKLLLTNVCIQSGWRGGHFFPVIFCGISIGYGVAMLSGLNIAFCLGVVTASLLGVIMRKPLAVTLLLLLCFPARVIPWLFIGAYVGSLVPLGKLAPQKH
ncbi:MAG: chloride channel protein [Ruminiclostridium sp.]|nr:chloride channel protein [Ruminiclostridium sp.]MBQ9932781.1 chloride channel protein [Ruminiclostridium sp.]